MILLVILTSLTIWITINVLVIGLCCAARLGDLQLAAVHAPHRSMRWAIAEIGRSEPNRREA